MDLAEKYRPKRFDDVVGHELAIKSIKANLKLGTHTFIFVGPSGVGKTTLARIVASEVGALPHDILEVDAASYTGIDDMRKVVETLQYRPFGQGERKGIIIDEFHALSPQAIKSLLKSLEEPPAWAYWFLCTTDPGKIPAVINTRCLRIQLSPLSSNQIYQDVLSPIADAESMPISDAALWLCAKEAQGSARQAISNLALCSVVTEVEEARKLLRTAEASVEAHELAKLLWRGCDWEDAQGLLTKLKETNPESVRHVLRAYFTTCAIGAKNDEVANRALFLLETFSTPFNAFDGMSPLVLACGKVIYNS